MTDGEKIIVGGWPPLAARAYYITGIILNLVNLILAATGALWWLGLLS